MPSNQANLIQLFKNDDVVCLPFEKKELLNYKQPNHLIKAKGQNQKKVLILVSHSIDDLNSVENVLLFNILKAIKLTIDDVQLVEFTGVPFKILFSMIDFDKCIMMGLKPKDVGLQMVSMPYQVFNFQNKLCLLSHSTNMLNKHKKCKENLWNALQKMFPITKNEKV